MKRITTTITAALVGVLAAGAAHAQSAPVTEQAISIAPSFTTNTRTECTSTTPASGGWLSQALGAIIGGGAGSQVGGGSGQAAAAAIGATLGAQAGAAMSPQPQAQPAQTCREIVERVLTGYMLRTASGRDIFVPRQLVEQFNSGGR